MSKEIILFEKDTLSITDKFFILMDLLISNQSTTKGECLFFLLIYYLQIISGFFAEQIEVFDIKNRDSDKILNYISKILRFKDLLLNKYSIFKIFIFIIFIIFILFLIFFIISIYNIKKTSFYSFREIILNYSIKIFIYIGYNIILDLCFSIYCFGSDEFNPNFSEIKCNITENLSIFLISFLLLLLSTCFIFFIQFFYIDSFFLNWNFYSKISCNYEIYLTLNNIFYSIFLIQAKYLSKEIFLLYNLIISSIFLNFYLKHYLYYYQNSNILAGLFHIQYVWTSIFFLIFAYIDFKEIGLIYIVSSMIVLYFYFNLKYKVEENIFLDTPFYKIYNKNYLLFYLKNIVDKMNSLDENPEDKALLAGIMQMHIIECPNPNCLSKNKEKLYLPISDEWSDRTKPLIEDKVFLLNFIIVVMNFFINQNDYSPDLIMNISLYYLKIIGNYCQSMFFYKKVKEMKLSFQEYFSFMRLKINISKSLIEKLKNPHDLCNNIEDLNVTMYYKYEDLSQTFVDEINNDINLSLEFWKIFRNNQIDNNKQIDFNKVFDLTNKIRITKTKVEIIWEKLMKIFNGVNDLFELYSDYVEQINDDDLKKRSLESLRRKNENFGEHISQNLYSLLFNKETGIIIANGDKGKEGIIEKSNNEIENIFKYKPEELKGMNLNNLMPKLFAVEHKMFMEKYFKTGEKKAIDQKDLKSFAKDKENCIIMIRLVIKLFPMLNENVFFCGMIIKENIDDIIFIDNKFNIQGISNKLMKILKIENKNIFNDNEIPFYVICKKFVNFYKIFLQGKKQNLNKKKNNYNNNNNSNFNDKKASIVFDDLSEIENLDEENNNNNEENENNSNKEDEFHEYIEINENIELEYEIKIPQFLMDYSEATNKKEKKNDFHILKENESIVVSKIAEDYINNENNIDTIDEFGESDLLVDDSNNNSNENNNKNNINNNNNVTPTPTPTPNYVIQVNKTNNENINSNIKSTKIEINKQSDEEKEFESKIKKYKDLFENGKFDELEDFIDLCTHNNTTKEYKFNFTFDRYKYSDKKMAYIVRCIDNKNEGGRSDEESIIDGDPKAAKYKKEKAEAIRPLYELLSDEKKDILEQPEKYFVLSNENVYFQKLLNVCREDINKMSMVHGTKKDEVMEDENSSQTSQTGFNSDLVKKNRIEEVRGNILNNISNFFTLKYIKIMLLLMFVFTISFEIIYVIIFSQIIQDLKNISYLNIILFSTTIWTSNLIGTIISLRALYRNLILYNYNYNFNSFIEDNYEYFENLTDLSLEWYKNISMHFGNFENQINDILNNKEIGLYFWDQNLVSYNNELIVDTEGFPLALSQVLSNVNSLLQLKTFELDVNKNDLTNADFNYLVYLSFLSVENAYDNLIPNLYKKVLTLPQIFKKYNSDSKFILLICLIVYSCVMIIFCLVYGLLLHITNKNMGEGLEKVTKIKLEKIEETIKRIENFNLELKKLKEHENQKINELNNNNEIDNNNNNNINNTEINNNLDINSTNNIQTNSGSTGAQASNIISTNGFSSDVKKFIPLKILNLSYFQTVFFLIVLGSFLIPVYLRTNTIISSTNKIIDVENFIFGKILFASASLVKVKCSMSNCNVQSELYYENLVDNSEIQKIVQGISLFSELNEFYNEKFLLNACEAVYIIDTNDYFNCMNDELIQSANNTDSLLKLIEEIVDNIYKDLEMQTGKKFILNNESEVDFQNYYLFSSNNFNQLELIFYKYIVPVSNNFGGLCKVSLNNYLKKEKILILILIICLGVIIAGFCIYIIVFFVKKLIHLLSVSRCILKIIPTTVINNTPDLEVWIENKY